MFLFFGLLHILPFQHEFPSDHLAAAALASSSPPFAPFAPSACTSALPSLPSSSLSLPSFLQQPSAVSPPTTVSLANVSAPSSVALSDASSSSNHAIAVCPRDILDSLVFLMGQDPSRVVVPDAPAPPPPAAAAAAVVSYSHAQQQEQPQEEEQEPGRLLSQRPLVGAPSPLSSRLPLPGAASVRSPESKSDGAQVHHHHHHFSFSSSFLSLLAGCHRFSSVVMPGEEVSFFSRCWHTFQS